MERVCLLIDVEEDGLKDTWQQKVASLKFAIKPQYATINEADLIMETAPVVGIAIFVKDSAKVTVVRPLLEMFRKKVGPIDHFQAVICSDPDGIILADMFEFGVDCFISEQTWPADLCRFCDEISDAINDEQSMERKIINLYKALDVGVQAEIDRAKNEIDPYCHMDYLAAFAKAQALQTIGDFEAAIESYRMSRNLNKFFRPASAQLGENLLVLGKLDEAIGILEQLDKSNPRDIERKAMLAAAYSEKGEYAIAQSYLDQASEVEPTHPKVLEAQAHILIAQGKAQDAFKLLDQLSEVGPFFAAKLNEMGIKLSQANKGKSALALYQKAHAIVKKELRYKVSFNAALACYRLEDFAGTLKYLDRCEREYGGSLEKVAKIRNACKASMKRKSDGQRQAG
jgi:tetratricopeptide (TPR) repeat protein